MVLNPCDGTTSSRITWTLVAAVTPLLVTLALSQIQKGNLATYLKMGAMIGGGTGLLTGVALWTAKGKEPVGSDDEPVASEGKLPLQREMSQQLQKYASLGAGAPDEPGVFGLDDAIYVLHSGIMLNLLPNILRGLSNVELATVISLDERFEHRSEIFTQAECATHVYPRLKRVKGKIHKGLIPAMIAGAEGKEQVQQAVVFLIGSNAALAADEEQLAGLLVKWAEMQPHMATLWRDAVLADADQLKEVQAWGVKPWSDFCAALNK